MPYLYAITLCCFFVVVRSQSIQELLDAEKLCEKSFPSITLDIMMELKRTREIEKFQKLHPDINCFINCMGRTIKVVDDAGKLDIERLKKFTLVAYGDDVEEERLRKSIDSCAELATHEDPCERVGEYLICHLAHMKGVKLHNEYCPVCN